MPFKPGQSGNPGGREKEAPEVKAIFRAHTADAAKVLVKLMNKGKTETTKLKAATTILERAWGKPSQEITGPEGNAALQFIINTSAKVTDDG